MDLAALQDKLEELTGKLANPLDSGSHPADKDVLSVSFSQDLEGKFGAGTWTFGAEVGAGIRVINDASDKDDQGIIGTRPDGPATTDPRPQLSFEADRAWLRYLFHGVAKGGIKATAGVAAVSISGEGRAAAGSYLPAARADTLQDAIESHLAAFPYPFSAADVARLQEREATFVTVGGQLAASLTLSWADLFTGPLTELRIAAAGDAPIVISAKASASVTFTVTVSDSFRVVFSRPPGSSGIRLAINKSESTAFALKAAASIDVGFENPEQVRAVLSSFTAQLLAPREQLQRLQDNLDRLISLYDDTVQGLKDRIDQGATRLTDALDRLGAKRALAQLARLQSLIDDVEGHAPALAEALGNGIRVDEAQEIIDRVRELPQRVADDLQNELDTLLAELKLRPLLEHAAEGTRALLERLAAIEKAIVSVAEKRVKLGVTFDYSRLATDAALFEADLDPAHPQFAQHHADALALELRPLLRASNADGVGLRLFLHQRSVQRRWALGLSLNSIGSTWSDGATWIRSDRRIPAAAGGGAVDRQHTTVLNGYREYSDRYFGGEKALYRGDLDAEFAGESANVGRWQYRLALQYEKATARADREWLNALCDQAEVWGAIGRGQAHSVATDLAIRLEGLNAPVKGNCSLILGQGVWTPTFCKQLAQLPPAALIGPVAAALPYWDDFPTRRSVEQRMVHYASLSALLIALSPGAPVHLPSVSKAAYAALRTVDLKLARREFKANQTSGLDGRTVAGVAYRHANVARGLHQLQRAASQMHRVMSATDAGSEARSRVEDALNQMDGLWNDGFSLRWLGMTLIALAKTLPTTAASVTCVFRLTIGEGDDARDIVIAPRSQGAIA